ncbi:MAG: PEP-CTERM sorting domain-containing protein [Bryobacterales bacterium]|nr:PEP-CTERM sorting domain-containing protein [Bryobacterales bacterium]
MLAKHLAVLACAALPALASPVGYATYLNADGVHSQFVSPSATRVQSGPGSLVAAGADLSQGALRIRTVRTSGSGGLGAQALFYDTITFDGSAFQGLYGASYNLNLTATYEGTFTATGTIDSAGVGGRIHIYSGDTVIDSGVFTDATSLTNFMFLGGPAPLCANGVNGPDLVTYRGFFQFQVSCSVTVTALNPTVRIFMNLPGFVNGGAATWDLDMMNTATLSLGDLEGRVVRSASGVLPGTLLNEVPEPSTMGLAALALAALWWRARRAGASD